MTTRAETILVLMEHKARLTAALTFEEFKTRQINFLDYLITTEESKFNAERAFDTFMDIAP